MLDVADIHAQARAAAEVFRGPGALAGPLPVPPGASSQIRVLAMPRRAR